MPITRRAFVAAAVAQLTLVARRARAQPSKMARIGVLLYGTPDNDPNLPAFRDGMRDLGYVEGRNLAYEYRYAEAKTERLAGLATELVKRGPHLIFALGGDVAPFARAATSTIPIVMAVSNDPVQTQMVSSLARPGGNITGVTLIASDLAAKRLQFLKEIAPAMTRVGILWNPDHVDPEFRETQVTARQLGLQLHSLEVRHPADLDGAFGAAATARLEAMVIVSSRLTAIARAQIQEAATKHQIVLVCGWGPGLSMAPSSRMGRTSMRPCVSPPRRLTKSSRVRSPASYRSSSRQGSSSSSTRRPRRPSASRCPRPCCSAPFR